MIKIEYPEPSFKIKKDQGKEYIFDSLRKRWLLLTPEEWVRQNFVQYLVKVRAYPSVLIALEKEIRLGELVKRFDILVYNRRHEPWMMIECKEMKVKLDEWVLQQVLRYNISVPVEYLVVTNGSNTFAWNRDAAGLTLLSELPLFGG